MSSNTIALALVFFVHFVSCHVSASDAVIEDGYSVTTVIDGPKMQINPHAVLLNPGRSDLMILDSTGSAFYTIPFPVSQDSVIKLLSGGEAGYKDGEPGSVRFNKPRSFAVDTRGNIYVADRNNNVIRKIATSGVTSTIAGVNKVTGRVDGPAQNATFSNDFELVFAAERCALLVSDHGNQLVRQIDLKPEDCKRDSGSGHGNLANSVWGTAVGVALLFSCAVGFVARPYLFTHQGTRINGFSGTWKLCLMTNPWKQIAPTLCSATRSVIANFSLVCSFFESLLFRIDRVRPLLDIDQLSDSSNSSFSISETEIVSEKYADQLKDLIPFDERSGSLSLNESDDLSNSFEDRSLESMIKSNVMHFSGVSVIKETSNLVRRK